MTETGRKLAPEDFAPLQLRPDVHGITRPSQSYWQDAWRRLKRNRRAWCSLWIVTAMLAFTILGPLIWQVDPAAQNVDLTSHGPTLGERALLVERGQHWGGVRLDDWPAGPTGDYEPATAPALPAPRNVEVLGTPSTRGVRLRWTPVNNAAGYHVYRNTYRPEAINELGLPLAETWTGNQVGYEDAMKLSAGTYYYSITADDGSTESDRFTTVRVEVAPAMTVAGAAERGIIASREAAEPSEFVDLPAHPLGTDYLGRDMLSRLMYGARTSLFIGIVAPVAFVLLGVVYGAFAGFLGARVDGAMMRIADFVVALPFLLFMILFRIAGGIGPGESGIMPILFALILLSWPATARLVRGQILQIRQEGYVQAARLLGARPRYLILRHMIPNTMGVILVTLTFAVPSAIFTEAFLSFIGMGVAPPTPSWGSMCYEGLKTMLTHPHELIFPAAFISVTVLAFNLLGDGLRDALDARMRSRE